jgi:hypothetical protein
MEVERIERTHILGLFSGPSPRFPNVMEEWLKVDVVHVTRATDVRLPI